MKFFLGTSHPSWLRDVDVPLMISRRSFRSKTLPVALEEWVLDSGGFTEVALGGGWSTTPDEYVDSVRWIATGVGKMLWAAPQDWMCEPAALAATGLSVEEHQRRTVENLVALRALAPELPIIPVLQGWRLADYDRCLRFYEEAGIDLEAEPVVGLGSVCRRQSTAEIEAIVLSLRPIRLHGFGVKTAGLNRYGYLLESADSHAWSSRERWKAFEAKAAGQDRRCRHAKNGATCRSCALEWRVEVLGRTAYQQTHLEAV